MEDIFKIGRSTGRLFKEKGVSLYKDKEISTTHAKVEIRNGQVFLMDVRSTNGTQLNGLVNLTIYTTLLHVHIYLVCIPYTHCILITRLTYNIHIYRETVEANVPLRLREGDVVTMGSTDLKVHISDLGQEEETENIDPDHTGEE